MLIPPDQLLPGPAQSDWPLFGLVDDVRPALRALLSRGESGALATLVAVDGPSPRPLGSQMLIDRHGKSVGYVSGGCVEGSIALLAEDVIASGKAQVFVFGADSPFKDIMLICGTRIEVLIEPVSSDDDGFKAMLGAYLSRQEFKRHVGIGILSEPYLCRHLPTVRLILFGHDPVALACVHLAGMMGVEAVLVRSAGPQAAPAGLNVRYISSLATAAFADLHIDAWTAIITTTHDLDQDHDVLSFGLASDSFYVGALGSKRRLEDRRAKLLAAGLSPLQIARLRAPVGLPIGAATPYEIAVSILADVIAARRLGPR